MPIAEIAGLGAQGVGAAIKAITAKKNERTQKQQAANAAFQERAIQAAKERLAQEQAAKGGDNKMFIYLAVAAVAIVVIFLMIKRK